LDGHARSWPRVSPAPPRPRTRQFARLAAVRRCAVRARAACCATAAAAAPASEQSNLSVKRLRAERREPDIDELAKEIANQLPVIDPVRSPPRFRRVLPVPR
jgi:hypothetical protein